MKGRISLLSRKIFATAIALAMSIPPTAFANNDQDQTQAYSSDSSIMGLVENSEEDKTQISNTDETRQVKDIGAYILEITSRLDESLEKIDYTIKAKKKEGLDEESDKNLSFFLTPVSNINKLSLLSANLDFEENDLDTNMDQVGLKLTSKASDEIIYELKADVNKAKDQRAYDLILGLKEEDTDVSILSYKLKAQTTTTILDDEEVEEIRLSQDEEMKAQATYKEEGILGGIFASHDTITWTDYIVNEDKENKEFTYDFDLDQNQNTENSKIKLDYYELTDNGFEIKKEFSQSIDFAEKINFEVPQGFIGKISLKTEVDKKNTAIKNYSLNNRAINNPIYKEGSEEENQDDEDDPLPAEENEEEVSTDSAAREETKEENPSQDKKEEEPSIDKEENKEETEEEKSSDTEIEVTDSTGEEIADSEEEKISAIILNKDSLLASLKKEDKLTDDLEAFIENLAKDLDTYNEEKITDQDLKDFTKAQATNNKIEKEDLRSYFVQILSGLNKQTNKAANLNIDEIIDYAYPAEKDPEKESNTEENSESEENKEEDLTNLEKADKELKEALADEKNGLEEIQALLDSFEEKYKLDRDAQEKLMTDNDSAIKALVEKDKEENFRPNNLRATGSFEDKKFKLTTTMKVIASAANPMPRGWHFDVDLGPYLKEDPANPIAPLKNKKGKVIAEGSYEQDTHKIRYTITEKLTSSVDLPIDQLLAFDMNEIGDTNPINIDISVQPKNMAVQKMDKITVSKDDEAEIISSQPDFTSNIESPENVTGTVEYPVILEYNSHQTLRDKDGNEAVLGVVANPQDLEVWWDIEVNIDKLFPSDKELDFNRLYFTLFASGKQGLNNGTYKIAGRKDELDKPGGYSGLGGSDLIVDSKSVDKNTLKDTSKYPDKKVYIRAKLPLKDNEYHTNYSLGLRVNPDRNYMEKIYKDFMDDYNKIPSIFKFIKGEGDAKKLASTPFNLVEDMFVAEFVHLGDPTVDENFYYDRTRTIVAEEDNDYSKRRWSAMDLLRIGETEDYSLANASLFPQSLKYTKYYYIPNMTGGYSRTTNQNQATLSDGSYKPGVIVYYDYNVQSGTKDTNFKFDVNLKQKPIDNADVINKYDNIETQGGQQYLYSRKLQQIDDAYLAYLELPYLIMRINNTFEMVQCLNARRPDPTVNGSKTKVGLDRIENPTGAMLYSNIADFGDIKKNDTYYDLLPGGKYNRNNQTKEDATEDLFKRIYFYAEEIKREYPGNHSNTEMHRMIENQMLQRVIHYFTDGKALTNDYAYVGTPTADDGKYHRDITLTDPNMLNEDQYFKGDNRVNSDTNGHRKLSENEKLELEGRGLKDVQVKYAQELLNRVQHSYTNNNWENEKKANTVTLVYFDHQSAKYQKLISGRVVDPIKAYKVDSEGNKLDGAEFSFVNRNTGEVTKVTATSEGMKVYLKEGSYRVRETKAPEGYELINPFNITVSNDEVNPDEGQYPVVGMRIKVNDGYKTEGKLSGVPKDIDGNDLVKQEDGKLEIEIVNISNKLGKLLFTKKDASKKLNGSEFRLTKIKSQTDRTTDLGEDNKPVYQKTSKGDYGDFEFSKMPVGFYLLEEIVVPKGYKKAADQIVEVALDESGKAYTRFLDEKIEASKVIINEAKTIDIKLRKVSSENEDQKLQDGKFRLYSDRTIDNILYFEERTSGLDGIVNFTNLREGEYILEELAAPSGYLLPKFLEEPDKFFGWKLFVKLDDKGDLVYDIYKLKTRDDAKKTEDELSSSKVDLDKLLKGGAINIGNKIRTVDWQFRKYIENPNFNASQKESATNPKFIPLTDKTKLQQIKFNVYEADYYGKIIDVHKPFLQDIQADENGIFHLKGLEFNGYYTLRETNTHGDYIQASDITLKIEAETIANEGEMKVIVRDPSNDVIIGEHAILQGVVNYKKGSKLGKLAIKKTGKSLWGPDNGKEVGLRRAFFRLYTADENYDIILNEAGYPKEYIQKVTNGLALTDEKGNPIDSSTLPKDQGVAVFENIKPGKYVLEEYRGPAGYEKDPRPIYVLVIKDGNVYKSRDKNDPILNQTLARSARLDQTYNDATTALGESRAGSEASKNTATSKTYNGQFATVKIDARSIDDKQGSRHMKVSVTAKNELIDFSLGYNSYVSATSWQPSDYSGIYNASSSNKYYKYNIQPNRTFTLEFDTKLKDGSEEDVYKNILNQVRVFAKYSQKYENHTQAFEDFKLIKKSNNFKAKVAFEYHYYDYEGIGEMNPQLIGTGKIWLQTLENGTWVDVPNTKKQAYKESKFKTDFPEYTGLDRSKIYRIAYQLEPGYNLDRLWNWTSDTSYYNIDQSVVDENGDVLVKIVNGNLMKIFNKDEDGFRIPLRIEKSNEDKSPLSGAIFRAKKIVDGDKIEGKDAYPKYYDEPFDAVTEATGLAGENYFRELTPGIYEMWEEKAPDEYTKLKSKWYFKVEVDPTKEPHEANYMRITFDFSYRFPNDLSDAKYQHLTEAEKDRLRGKTIFGLNSNSKTEFEDDRLTTDSYKEFIRNVKILPDNEISKPARPDAPYKGIDVVGVTNHKTDGQLEFKKVGRGNAPIDGAVFRLTKVRVESNGKLIIKTPDNRPDPVKDDNDNIVYQKEVTSKGILGVKFEGISEGTYILEEIKAPTGYNKINSYAVIKFKENEDSKIVQEVDKDQSDPNFLKQITLKNNSEIQTVINEENLTRLVFEKINSYGASVGTSMFNLQAVDNNGNLKKDASGEPVYDRIIEKYDDYTKYEFTDLKEGRYKLTEINHTIYAKPDPWYFDVVKDKNENLTIEFENKEDRTIINNNDGTFKIVNYAKTNFRFTKIGQGMDSPPVPLSNIYFSLKKVRTDKGEDGISISYDNNGNVTSMKDKDGKELIEREGEYIQNPEILGYSYYTKTRTLSDGSINFSDLSPGVYELEEITQHESYNKNTQKKWILLVEPGNDKLEVSYNKDYEIAYYQTYDKDYYDKYYQPRNYAGSNLLTGNEQEGFNVLNIRNKVDIKWRKVDANSGGVIHELKQDPNASYDRYNAKFTMFTLHQGIISEDSKEFYDAWHKTGWQGSEDDPDRPVDIYTSEGTFAIYGLEPGVYAIPETQSPQGYKTPRSYVMILVTEKGKLNKEDPNYVANSNELVYKLFEVESVGGTLETGPQLELRSDPKEFKLIAADKDGEIIFNKDGFFDFKNEPNENDGSFEIEKKDSKNRPLAGAVFELLDFQGQVVKIAKSDENGKVVFSGITAETYTLREAQPPTGYKKTDQIWTVFVYSNGHTFIKEGNVQDDYPEDVTDYKRPVLEVKNSPIQETGEFTVSKVDREANPLQGAIFKLEKTKDENGKDLTPPVFISEKTSDTEGKIKFENLEPGSYELTESKAPDDYKKVTDKWIITVDKEGTTTVNKSTANFLARSLNNFLDKANPVNLLRADDAEVPIKDIKVVNEKIITGNFQIKKTDTDKTTVLAGADFSLTRIKDEVGDKVEGEKPILATSNSDGIAKFEKLLPGEYKLKESKAPLGYEKLEEEYTVKVIENNGKVSVKISQPDKTENVMASEVTNSEESILNFTAYDGGNYAEGKVKYNIAKTTTFGEYWLGVEFTPTQTYSARRALRLIFDTDNFDVYYLDKKLAANNANITLNTWQNSGTQKVQFFLRAKDPKGNKTLNPIKQFSWAGRVDYYIETSPNAYPKIELINETQTIAGEEIELKEAENFEYTLVNNKSKYKTEFLKVGKEVQDGKITFNPLENAVFTIEKKDADGNYQKLDKRFVSDVEGKLVLNDLEIGEYKLYETSPPKGYRPIANAVKEFKIDELGRTQIKNRDNQYEPLYEENRKIVNEKYGAESYEFTKRDGESKEPLAGVEFELLNSYGEVIDTKTSDTYGKVKFDNLQPGKYWIREKTQNDGYAREKNPVKIVVGEQWEAPDHGTDARNVSSFFSLDPLKPSSLTSTSGSETTVYPNVQEGLFAKLNFIINKEVNPGDRFVMTLSDNVDLDGLSTINDREFDIYGPMGRVAVAKVRDNRHVIDYTFTEAVDYYNDLKELTINTQMFVNRKKVPYNQEDLKVTIRIQDTNNQGAEFTDTIDVNYDNETNNGYINARENVKTYQLKLGTSSENPRKFKNVIYVNPVRSKDGYKDIYFSANLPYTVSSLRVYKKTIRDNKDLPWSFDIDHKMDSEYGLVEVTNPSWEYVNGKIHVNLGQDQTSYNTDEYVIEVSGTVNATGDFKTHTQYERMSQYYDLVMHTYYPNVKVIDYWDTWARVYNPDTQADLVQDFYNYKNRIEFTKVIKDTDTPLSGVKFELRKEGQKDVYTKVEGSERTSNDEGKFAWEGLEEGKYQVWETESLEGYKNPENPVSSFEINGEGQIENLLDDKKTIENEKEGMKFYIDKVWKDADKKSTSIKKGKLELALTANDNETFPANVNVEKEIPEGRAYRVKKVSDDRKTITLEIDLEKAYEGISEDANAKEAIRIEVPGDWPQGRYSLKEIKAPAGYNKTDQVFSIFVDHDNNEIRHDAKTLYKNGSNGEIINILEIENKKGIFPNTGGPGTWIGFTVLGLVIMIAGVFLYNKKQARLSR